MNIALTATILFCLLFAKSGMAEASANILMVVNEGFWAPEYFVPRAKFEEQKFKIAVAATKRGLISPDRRNSGYDPVQAELSFEQVRVTDYDAIVFVGGNGAWTDYFPNEEAHRIVKEALVLGKTTALLCASTGLLGFAYNFDGKTPIVVGRKVTGYFRVRGILEKLALVAYQEGDQKKPFVVVDGNLVTGRDPASAELFAQVVIRELSR